MTTKTLTNVQIKDADQGLVTAVISTFGVIDKDGDVTSKGTFDDGAPVVISAYGHKSWEGALPLGNGTITTTDTEAVADLKFLLNTTHGRDAFETIKALSAAGLQEWSYSLKNTVARKGQLDGQPANFLDHTDVKEVSPVLMGASIDTRTLSVKSGDEEPVTKFSEQADIALRGVKQLVEMAVERLTHRAAEGKSITEQTEAYDQFLAEIAPLKAAIDGATQPPTSDLEREYLRFVALSQGANQ